jgi:hypothetical protein
VNKAEALKIIGGLSRVSAMPCPSFSISAFDCQTGGKLAEIPGSVCSKCYARRGYYHWPTVKAAHAKRLQKINQAIVDPVFRKLWLDAFVRALQGVKWFRWHDSGDLQSAQHFNLIATVCELTPGTRHWLPTKELRYVSRWVQWRGQPPDNLTVRVSAPMIDEPMIGAAFPTANVHKRLLPPAGAFVCPVPTDRKSCGECRACWNPGVKTVSYPETW